ncbi:ADP-ribosylation factor GTPase-activating protein GCS1, partial [Smittium culicis]
LGGNKKALEFFKSQPDYSQDMGIKEKYTSRFADLWRQKITAEFEGRAWSAPPPSAPTSQLSRNSSNSSTTRLYSKTSLNSNKFGSSSNLSRSGSYSGFARESSNEAPQSDSNYPVTEKEKKELYFSKLGAANRERPDNLPPSQGGRYTGFGSSASPQQHRGSSGFDPREIVDDPSAALYKGFSLLTTGAIAAIGTIGNVAGSINENYIKPTTEKVLDPNFRNEVAGYVSHIGKNVEIQASRGISEISKIAGIGKAQGNAFNSSRTYGGYGNNSRNEFNDDDDNDSDFFNQHSGSGNNSNVNNQLPKVNSSNSAPKKTNSWDDEWDNF